MRPLLLLAALAGLSSAQPAVRWITPAGDLRAAPVAEVLEERVDRVRVRTADGQVLEIAGGGLLELVREGEADGALLEARLKAAWGWDLEGARAALDALLKAQGEAEPAPERAWVREYAEAARAVAAERLGEADAAARIAKALADRPRSRFACDLLRAEARLKAAAAAAASPGDFAALLTPMRNAYDRIDELKGPRLQQFLTYRDSLLFLASAAAPDRMMFLQGFESRVDEIRADEGADLPMKICAQSVKMWLRLDTALAIRQEVLALGMHPDGARTRLEGVRDQSRFLPPELMADLRLALGDCMRDCGMPEEARKEWAASREVAPDPLRRARAEAALKAAAG